MLSRLTGFLLLGSALFAMDPSEALNLLVKGNRRYVADKMEHPDRSMDRRSEISQLQNPFAVIVGCSDSRVPPEIIFDQGLGDLFVVRVAGQVVGPVEIDSIDYSIKVLGSVLVLVLGHQSCGAIKAVLDGNTADIEAVASLIEPAVKNIPPKNVDKAVKANVRWVVDRLKQTPYIKKMMAEGKLDVVGGYYSLSDGHIDILH